MSIHRRIHWKRQLVNERIHPQQDYHVEDTITEFYLRPTKGWRKNRVIVQRLMVPHRDLHKPRTPEQLAKEKM